MASNLAGLADNIEQSIASLASSLGISGLFGIKPNGDGAYPEDLPSTKEVISTIKPENWGKSLPYTFSIVDDVSNASEKTSKLGFSDFPLPLNPSEITQEEPFAIKVVPTQGGSTVHQNGLKYGDLVISGTTGLQPFKGAGGASKTTGKAVFQPDDLKHRSGYDVFLSLRNWFKAYYQLKSRSPLQTASSRLVFKNFKDGDFLIVELMKFSMKRSAARSFLYDYTLQFKILGRVQFTPSQGAGGFFAEVDSVINTAENAIDTARGVFLRSQDILRQVESTYENTVLEPLRKATLAIKAFTGIGTVAADVSKQAISNTVSAVAALGIALGLKSQQDQAKTSGNVDSRIALAQLPSNLDKAAQAQGANLILNLGGKSDVLMAMSSSVFPVQTMQLLAKEQADSLELPRSFFENAISEITRVRDNAVDKFNLGDAIYNAQFDRVVSSQADATKVVTDREFELLAGFESALEGLDMLLSTTALFKTPYDQRIAALKGGFSDDLPTVTAQPAVKEIRMPHGVDLERLALTELGDPSRWVEIAEVNDLKAPFVIQDMSDTTANVIHPGDKILIPQPILEGFGDTPTVKERFINEDLNAVERNLGIDFKLSPDGDLSMGNRGDIEIVRGADNAAQAVILKLSYDKKELLEHPEIGVGLTVGTKGDPLSQIQTSLMQTLTADPRFSGIQNLTILRQNSALYLNFELKVKNVDTPIPVSLKL